MEKAIEHIDKIGLKKENATDRKWCNGAVLAYSARSRHYHSWGKCKVTQSQELAVKVITICWALL